MPWTCRRDMSIFFFVVDTIETTAVRPQINQYLVYAIRPVALRAAFKYPPACLVHDNPVAWGVNFSHLPTGFCSQFAIVRIQ